MNCRFEVEKTFHPTALFFYYLCIIMTIMLTQSLVFALIALIVSVVRLSLCDGIKKALPTLSVGAIIIIFSAAVNAIIGKRGETVLFYAFSRPFTLEAIQYGISSGVSFIALFIWFCLFSKQFTSEKLRAVSGELFPRTSLFFSMTLKSVSSFSERVKKCRLAYTSLYEKQKNSLRSQTKIILSALSLECEGALCASLSMRSRGYLSGKRRQCAWQRFTRRDVALILCSSALCTVDAVSIAGGGSDDFFPSYKLALQPLGIAAFFLLCVLTLFLELWEEYKWHRLSQKS